jgi:hypothetical protein
MNTDSIRILKTGTCPSLSGRTKLTYEVGGGPGSLISLRITKTAGTGSFSKDWIGLDRVHALLEKQADKPITSHTLAPLFTSANNPGFTLAVMKHERLVRPIADNPRCYERLDGKAFFSEIEALMTGIPAVALNVTEKTKSTKASAAPSSLKAVSPKPDETTKPASDLDTTTKPADSPKVRPAVYVSEVHGPLVPEPRKPAKRAPAKR